MAFDYALINRELFHESKVAQTNEVYKKDDDDQTRKSETDGYLPELKRNIHTFVTNNCQKNEKASPTMEILLKHLNKLEKVISDTADLPVESQIRDWFHQP